MAKNKKNCTLVYRRIEWIKNTNPPSTLESLIRQCLKALPNVADTVMVATSGQNIDIRHRSQTKTEGVFLHLVAYTPDEAATITPDAPNNAAEAELKTMKPTRGHHIVDHAATLQIKDDHLLICFSGLRESHIRNYFNALLLKGGPANTNLSIDFTRKADIKKIKLIKEEGVKHIDLNVTLYEATAEHLDRKSSIQDSVREKMVEALKAFALRDKTRTELEEKESLTAKVLINVDGRKKDKSNLGYERLEDLAQNLLNNDDNEGFVIVTKKGKKIKSDEISLSKSVKLGSDGGKAVLYNEAWSELRDYLKELISNNTLEL